MEGAHVLEAAGACQALLGAAADRDWARRIPEMDWTVAEAVGHMAEGTLWYATDLAAGERRSTPWSCGSRPRRTGPTSSGPSACSPPCSPGWSSHPAGRPRRAPDGPGRRIRVRGHGLRRAASPQRRRRRRPRRPLRPAARLVKATLTRLFPWAPDADPWPALLWCNGRIALPGLPRQDRWAWHCAPLEEWDGLNPADRR